MCSCDFIIVGFVFVIDAIDSTYDTRDAMVVFFVWFVVAVVFKTKFQSTNLTKVVKLW